ncbi:MobP3 family relaxase [Bacillus sp. FJAT-28004]|uniref:MobP3 family relaxase n=1 Tax=Bacillus sp. FJAT-28004 TaxID=1679165 RepID=UPI0006B41791|nr:MobP3 family relaxase [Bacillus sp. FJAT-28004]
MSEHWETLMNEHAQFQAPFICNIEFTTPSRFASVNKGVVAKNVNHINYIHERAGSHGLVSSDEQSPNIDALKDEMRNHKGVVWRVVLSLTEEDAKRLDYMSSDRWKTALQATVPEAAAQLGIGETNLRWEAAFHEEGGHPHVHLVMWEKTPKRRRAVLSPAENRAFKKTFQNVVYAEERSALFQQKTMTRDLIRDLSKKELVDAVSIVREIHAYEKSIQIERESGGLGKAGIAPKIYDTESETLSRHLADIASQMPTKGRMALQFMPEQVKESVSATTKWLLQQPAYYQNVHQYYGAVEAMTRQYSFQEKDITKALDNARADLEKRVSQVVLRAAAETRKKSFVKVNPERAVKAVELFSTAMGRPLDNQATQVLQESVAVLERLGMDANEQKQLFQEWFKKADLKIKLSEVERIIDDLYKKISPDLILQTLPEKDAEAVASILKLAGRDDKTIIRELHNAGIKQETIEKTMVGAKQTEKESSSFFMKENDWNRLAKNIGITTPYPWEEVEHTVVIPENQKEVLEQFSKGSFRPDIPDVERGYTAYCMTVALKQMNFNYEDRKNIMMEFTKNNPVSDMQRILDSIQKVETSYLKTETWSRLAKNLNTELKYPWQTTRTVELIENKFGEALQDFKQSAVKIENADEVKWTAERLIPFLKSEHEAFDVKNELMNWADRTKNLTHDEVNALNIWNKRTEDIQVMGKHFGIVDSIVETVSQLTKVYVAAGLNSELINKLIKDWNQRSGANIDETRLDKIISGTEKTSRDGMDWGRPPYLKKQEFDALSKTLGVDAPYLWGGDKGQNQNQYTPSMNLAKQLWKSAWQAIDQERMKNQAQGEMLKRQNQRKMQRAAAREQGDD